MNDPLDRCQWDIGPGAKIHPEARIEVTEKLVVGARTVINRGALVQGTRVELGRECWIAEGASIGGGGCYDWRAYLQAGDWLHMGRGSHVNIARGVYIGDEVGIGRDTRVYTHGAYLSAWDGYPVRFDNVNIASRVWLPAATVLPGVAIGTDVVVAAGSLVNRDLPGGCLAGGVPARVISEKVYPRELTSPEKEMLATAVLEGVRVRAKYEGAGIIQCGQTVFDLDRRAIAGPATADAALLKDHLRRYGIRFRYEERDGEYMPWR